MAFTNAIFVDAERDGHKWLKEWKEEQNRWTIVTNRSKTKNLTIWDPTRRRNGNIDEMREQLEMVVQYGDFQPSNVRKNKMTLTMRLVTTMNHAQLLGHMNEVMETIDGGW